MFLTKPQDSPSGVSEGHIIPQCDPKDLNNKLVLIIP